MTRGLQGVTERLPLVDDDSLNEFRRDIDALGDQGVPFDKPAEERRGRPRKPAAVDAWSFVDEDDANTAEYSEFKVYTRATNKHDHSAKLQTHLPPMISGMVQQLIESRAIPAYRSTQDFVRDAIYHRLKFWADNIDSPMVQVVHGEQLNLQAIAAITEEQAMVLTEYEQLMARVSDVMNVFARGDILHKDELIRQIETGAARMREPYKSRLTEVLARFRD